MPRSSRSSGGRSFGGKSSFFSRPAASSTSRNTPAPVAPSPPPAPRPAGSAVGGIGSTIAEGMAFGTGSAIAHRAVDGVMGPRTIVHETVASPAPAAGSATMATSNSLGGSDACNNHVKAFQDCLNTSGSDISKCQFYMDMLSECRKNSDYDALDDDDSGYGKEEESALRGRSRLFLEPVANLTDIAPEDGSRLFDVTPHQQNDSTDACHSLKLTKNLKSNRTAAKERLEVSDGLTGRNVGLTATRMPER
ncbi:hypothetical protein ACH5RR_034722 [Cinchona calisaya]|uniref:CHCH domain-containing protein n=1 Tax=Cinchona calisaya TaxID=153742 RepID=A0ABD2YDU4_9GENT